MPSRGAQADDREGGKPRADIAQGEIDWEGEMNRVVSVALGEQSVLRPSSPTRVLCPSAPPALGPVRCSTLAKLQHPGRRRDDESWLQQAGVWRFGINFDTTGIDFPFRWAMGRQEDLEKRVIDGKDQWYLLPGKSGEVSGCIVLDEKPPVGTTFWWGGLIHQNVEVANDNVDRITVRWASLKDRRPSPRHTSRRQIMPRPAALSSTPTAAALLRGCLQSIAAAARYAGTDAAVWVVDNAGATTALPCWRQTSRSERHRLAA